MVVSFSRVSRLRSLYPLDHVCSDGTILVTPLRAQPGGGYRCTVRPCSVASQQLLRGRTPVYIHRQAEQPGHPPILRLKDTNSHRVRTCRKRALAVGRQRGGAGPPSGAHDMHYMLQRICRSSRSVFLPLISKGAPGVRPPVPANSALDLRKRHTGRTNL